MGALQPWHWIVLIAVILLLFGSTRLPGLAKSVGQSMKIFKREINELRSDGDDDTRRDDRRDDDVRRGETTRQNDTARRDDDPIPGMTRDGYGGVSKGDDAPKA
ncbi:Sec-independent protein translocase subunit TatA [Myceligenerans pegani]|uniref:Sec-independent protein translocase protein TatA n=1 Tax=Myceligenerans pegani TaxID=2776917 RepID=A0ABR9MU78_9MICO|nr:Sec-independent protein translocase subunit TatA [Myceligenerans sp. TRM 65318]MBE1874920.1 Sec-independent protein translocase subunit TatA [Myceligenerans sp. TRM 65318]MBE3017191.1 Sec-independent protein translocase subunit TatA [Myceligenerans sp. TRM 65318]